MCYLGLGGEEGKRGFMEKEIPSLRPEGSARGACCTKQDKEEEKEPSRIKEPHTSQHRACRP